MANPASAAFVQWVETSIAPIARWNGLTGKGPVFRRRDGRNWVVFRIERRHMDPQEAMERTDDPQVEFRLDLGAYVPATRPAWDDRKARPPSGLDLTVRTPSLALEPPAGEPWHIFQADDPAGQERLTELIRTGLGEALAALGPVDARRVLDMRLPFIGALENLAPGHAEELLLLADEAGDTGLRQQIVEALKRDRVHNPEDAERRRLIAGVRDIARDMFGPNVTFETRMPLRDERISEVWRPGRRLRKTRDRLLADLRSERTHARRNAASELGGWDGDPGVVLALRAAISDPDGFTRLAAASSLAHVRDSDSGTWLRVLALEDEADAGPSELGEAIVLLARLDPAERAAIAIATLERMVDRYPAWTRRLRALASLLHGPES